MITDEQRERYLWLKRKAELGGYKEPVRLWVPSGHIDNKGNEVDYDHPEARRTWYSVER